jgi:serine/threonine-protein kinase RsbW
MRLPAVAASAAIVRRRIAEDLAHTQVPAELVADVVLVATELVGNAIRHAAPLPDGAVTVVWEVGSPGVTVRVTDGGASGQPRLRHPSPNETSGRGLTLVHALATRWGVEDDSGSTTVWAELIG